jgi:hypothetical protein
MTGAALAAGCAGGVLAAVDVGVALGSATTPALCCPL